MTNFFKHFTVATAALAIAAPAFAGAPEAAERSISYANLDLSKQADRATLNHRIAMALEAVCGSYDGASIEEAEAIKSCRQSAKAQADARVAAITANTQTMRLAGRR